MSRMAEELARRTTVSSTLELSEGPQAVMARIQREFEGTARFEQLDASSFVVDPDYQETYVHALHGEIEPTVRGSRLTIRPGKLRVTPRQRLQLWLMVAAVLGYVVWRVVVSGSWVFATMILAAPFVAHAIHRRHSARERRERFAPFARRVHQAVADCIVSTDQSPFRAVGP